LLKKQNEKKIKNPNLDNTTMLGHKVNPLRQNIDYIVATTIAKSRLIISSVWVFSLNRFIPIWKVMNGK
jgi:hypothetical protein